MNGEELIGEEIMFPGAAPHQDPDVKHHDVLARRIYAPQHGGKMIERVIVADGNEDVPGRTFRASGRRASAATRLNWSRLSALSPTRREYFSETVKMVKNATVKATPEIVAISLVKRLIMAVANSVAEIRARPTGNSTRFQRTFSGTLNCRGRGSVKRSTMTARAFMAKLQITPKAYASPSTITFPRLSSMVKIWRPTIRLMMRYEVPKRG